MVLDELCARVIPWFSVDRAGSWGPDDRKFLDQLISNLWGTPTQMLLLDLEVRLLNLEWRFIRMAIGASGPIFQPTDTEILVTIKYLVTSLSGDTKLPTHDWHFLIIE